ncbi:aromatic ring-hydroxylating oxygenase subunit alpha [Sphingomonas sp. SRS2]|uniref:aromatic ring-hydroxylating oxygenase subunit alpha n=1 Tax=Sphingomonas sp. SRS2 TaxID=133190 RepID=UPI000696B502|nr:aromatic ring-hydroxylating dioxygenase subunit alpha [Sphingomonas sp. SRS2]
MDFQDLVENDSIHASLYTNAEIFDEEIKRIFENGWVWVAHESEIAEPKSFKTTVIGRQPVIATRDIDGKVYVMLNRCRHRAAAVCEVEQGQTPRFRCPYHGWLYNLSGKLIGVPSAEGYGEDFDRADFPLQQVRAEQYGGFWFATMNDEAESLSDFLGEAKPWIDLFNKQSAGWPLAILGAHKFTYDGNWKIALENSSDGYHLPVVHNSYLKYVDSETADRLAAVTNSETLYVRTLGNGHCIGLFDDDAVDLDLPSRYPKPNHYKALEAELLKDYPQDVTEMARSSSSKRLRVR